MERRPWTRWLWLGLPGFAVVALALGARSTRLTPTHADWDSVLAVVDAELAPGDVIWVHPTWSAAPWAELEAIALNKGLARGNVFLHADPVTEADVARFRRVWLLQRTGDAPPQPLRGAVEPRHAGGRLQVHVATVAVGAVATDFLGTLEKAQVERMEPDGGRGAPCRWSGDRQRCEGPFWKDVRVQWTEVGNTRRRCVFAQPHPDRGTLRIRFPAVPLGTRLVGGVGLNLWANRYEEGSDVRFGIAVDGATVYETQLPRQDFTWHTVDVPTTPGAHEVVVSLSADDARWRQACFDLVALEAAP